MPIKGAIAGSTYRYKRPPKRKKPVAIPHRIVTPSRKSKLATMEGDSDNATTTAEDRLHRARRDPGC